MSLGQFDDHRCTFSTSLDLAFSSELSDSVYGALCSGLHAASSWSLDGGR